MRRGVVALLLFGHAAWACTMMPKPVCDYWDASTHVILADIVGPVESVQGGKSAKARVVKIWKGTTASEWITVYTVRSLCTSDEIKAGEKLVLFGNSRDGLTISAPWRRLPLESAKVIHDVEYLDAMATGNWFSRQWVSNKVCVYDFWKKWIEPRQRKN